MYVRVNVRVCVFRQGQSQLPAQGRFPSSCDSRGKMVEASIQQSLSSLYGPMCRIRAQLSLASALDQERAPQTSRCAVRADSRLLLSLGRREGGRGPDARDSKECLRLTMRIIIHHNCYCLFSTILPDTRLIA